MYNLVINNNFQKIVGYNYRYYYSLSIYMIYN